MSRPRQEHLFPPDPPGRWPTKEDCPGCIALVDKDGRFQPGFCGPECLMRDDRDRNIAYRNRMIGY